MKKILIVLIVGFIPLMLFAQDFNDKSHHTKNGFRNPFPDFEGKDFGDFLQWSVVDRINGKKPDKPDSYNFPLIRNDGKYLRENKDKFTITWIGHSTLLIQIDGMNILTDPIWSDRCSPVQFAGPKRHVPPGVKLEDLPPIDAVIISHNHYDHLDRLTVQYFGDNVLFFVPLGIGNFLEDLGITNYEELDWWDEINFNGLKIACVPAQHFSNRGMFDRNKTLWCGWVVQGKTESIYFAGDTGYFPGFKKIGEKFGPISVAAIPIGAYLPRWFMSPVHVSPQEAVQAYLDLNADYFVPIHWGTFELADEPLDNPPKVLKQEIINRELVKEKFVILQHGETRIFNFEEVITASNQKVK
jgi:L-ascorbate metabolism protein UlaG (beta-lactamase superfamily)